MIAYSATLDVPEDTATLLTELLVAERLRRGTGIGARAASCYDQAVLVLRWFREDTGMPVLARDAGVSQATGYRYLHEGIDVLCAQAPDLHEALEAGAAAGWTHVTVDGTLIRTDRVRTKNPDTGHDLWFSGKHKAHGGNVQIVADPDGHPAAVSDVRPGSAHDLTAARVTGFLGVLRAAATLLELPALADKGYDGTGIGVHTPANGGRQAPKHGLPQPAADSAMRRGRARHRAAQEPMEGATPHSAVSSANRRYHRGRTCPDQRRAATPLKNLSARKCNGRCCIRWSSVPLVVGQVCSLAVILDRLACYPTRAISPAQIVASNGKT